MNCVTMVLNRGCKYLVGFVVDIKLSYPLRGATKEDEKRMSYNYKVSYTIFIVAKSRIYIWIITC